MNQVGVTAIRSDGRHAEPGDTGWSLCGARLSLDAQAAFTPPRPTGLNLWSHDPADRHSGLSPGIRLVPDWTNDACQCLVTSSISSCGPLSPTRLFPEPSGGGCTRRGCRANYAPARFVFVSRSPRPLGAGWRCWWDDARRCVNACKLVSVVPARRARHWVGPRLRYGLSACWRCGRTPNGFAPVPKRR